MNCSCFAAKVAINLIRTKENAKKNAVGKEKAFPREGGRLNRRMGAGGRTARNGVGRRGKKREGEGRSGKRGKKRNGVGRRGDS